MSEIKYPKVIAGVFIFNEQDELLLIKAPRWHNKYTAVGGRVEMNESLEDAVKREVKEETNLDVFDIKFFTIIDGLKLGNSYKREDNHLVFVDYKVKVKNTKKLKFNEEVSDHKWLKLDEWLKKDKKEFALYLHEILIKLKEGDDDFKHKYLHALADYQNLIKRTEVEKQEFIKYANERLLTEILPVYDNLKLALLHANPEKSGLDDANAVMEGVKHVLSQFKNVLENLGVKEIKTIGEKFDHHSMEAVEKKETDDKKQDGIVESEIMPGYRLGDKVIRAARVVVYEVK